MSPFFSIIYSLVLILIVGLGGVMRRRDRGWISWLLFLALFMVHLIAGFVSYRWEKVLYPLMFEDIVIIFPVSCAALALSATGKTNGKRKAMITVTFLAGLIVSLAVAEIVLRTTNVIPVFNNRIGQKLTFRRNDRIDIFFMPIPGRNKLAELHDTGQTMSGVFRVHDSSVVPYPGKMKDEKRVLWLGDSMTEGAGVDESANFVNLLEKRTKIPHYSLALGSTSTDIAAYMFERYSSVIDPDIVILGFFPGNDYFEFGVPEIACGFNSVYAPDGNDFKANCPDPSGNIFVSLFTRPPSILIQYASAYTRLGNFLMDERDRLYRLAARKLFRFHNPWPAFSVDKYSLEISRIENAGAVCSMVRRLQNDVESEGAKFALAVMPYVINPKVNLYPSTKPEMSAEAIRKCASELGVPLSDTMEIFGPMQKSGRRGEIFLSGMNFHLNPNGHKMAAEFLLPFERELLRK